MSPLLVPTTTMPKPAAGPADSGSFNFLIHTGLPVSTATASTSPLSEAAKTVPLSSAGPKPSRSLICFFPPPTLSPQILVTGSVAGNFMIAAGGSTSLSLEQPAAATSMARPRRGNRRIRVWPCSWGSAGAPRPAIPPRRAGRRRWTPPRAAAAALRSTIFNWISPGFTPPISAPASAAVYSAAASFMSFLA